MRVWCVVDAFMVRVCCVLRGTPPLRRFSRTGLFSLFRFDIYFDFIEAVEAVFIRGLGGDFMFSRLKSSYLLSGFIEIHIWLCEIREGSLIFEAFRDCSVTKDTITYGLRPKGCVS